MKRKKHPSIPFVFHTLLVPLYPLRCMSCGRLLAGEKTAITGLCRRCTLELFDLRLRENLCCRCGRPLISEEGECLYCRGREYQFESNHSIFLYEGKVRELIGLYKFKSQRGLAGLWAWFFADYLRRKYPDAVVVPVPGRKSSVRRRGWDQMGLITRILEKKYKISVRYLLVRRGGASQKTLSYEGRMNNLRGRIRLRRGFIEAEGLLTGEILLVDDIFTTGASLSEAARILKEAGAESIRTLTIARAPH
jgi:ComF family protein